MNQDAARVSVPKWQGKIAKKFEPQPRYLIPVLQYLQHEAGYLPPNAMSAAARYLGVSEAKVYGVASFYAQFHFEPKGRHIITVCRGTACHVRGSGALLNDLERKLGIRAGETTKDMEFSLETVACFGSCALAPVVVSDEKVHGRQTSATAIRMVDAVASNGASGAKPPKGKSPKGKTKKSAGSGRR